MTTSQTVLVSIGSSTVLVAIINGIFTLAGARRKAKHGEGAGIRILLYDRIKHLCKYHIAEGGITAEDLEDLMQMHKIYHDDLKGNGYLDVLMSQVKKLPMIPKVVILHAQKN